MAVVFSPLFSPGVSTVLGGGLILLIVSFWADITGHGFKKVREAGRCSFFGHTLQIVTTMVLKMSI